MKVQPVQTPIITPNSHTLEEFLDFIPSDLVPNNSVIAVTSKVVSICEGSVVPIDPHDPNQKHRLIQEQCERFIPPELNAYGVSLTIKNSMLIPTSGIDGSNIDGYYALWPADPQTSANRVRAYLSNKLKKRIGVIITDSTTAPLRWGTAGVAIAHSGFEAVNSYIGTPDLFGHPLKITKSNIATGLAAAAVAVMGEGTEQTPVAILSDLPFVKFTDRDPTQEELDAHKVTMEDDLYAQLLIHAPWKAGGRHS